MNVGAARTALVTLVGAANAPIDPPACYVFSNGTDFTGLGGSSVEWGFRVTCAVGYAGDDAKASGDLATFVAAKLTALQGAAGWRILSVGADGLRTIAGGDQLTADIAVATKVDI